MNKLKKFLLFVILITIFNCQKEDSTIEAQSDIPSDKVELKDGTLVFSSIDFLSRQVDQIKEMEDVQKEQFLYSFYDKGFQPLFPRYREDDVTKITQFTDNKKARLQKTALLGKQVLAAKGIPTEIDEDGELV